MNGAPVNALVSEPGTPFAHPQEITLQAAQKHHFPAFIVGNARYAERVVGHNTHVGQTVVICGAGPSLRETAGKWCPKGDEVWGCNSAATWLAENGHRVTHGFTVDQTPMMLVEWKHTPDIGFYLASSVHPFLTELLIAKGRPITWFHNYVGLEERPVASAVCQSCHTIGDTGITTCPTCEGSAFDSVIMSYEEWMYATLFPETVVTGSGLNSVTRAVDLALFMGFSKIIILGADCAMRTTKAKPENAGAVGTAEHMQWLRDHTVMHADGGSALASNQSCLTLDATIDGRYWLSKPDMLCSAVCLVQMKRALGSRLAIMGDTLPKALMGKDDAFLARLPTLTSKDGTPLYYALPPFLTNTA